MEIFLRSLKNQSKHSCLGFLLSSHRLHALCDVIQTIVLQNVVCSVPAVLAASRPVTAELHPHRCRSLRLRRQLLGILRCRARVSLPPVLREYSQVLPFSGNILILSYFLDNSRSYIIRP